jgi:cardiolipin synthase
MQSLITPRIGRILFLGVFTGGMLAACATDQAVVYGPRQLATPLSGVGGEPQQPLVASRAGISARGEIVIHYVDGGQLLAARGWIDGPGIAAPDDSQGEGAVSMPVLRLALAPRNAIPATDSKSVAIRAVEDWRALVRHVAEEAAGLTPGRGVVLDVMQEQELLLFLDDSGELHAWPLADKPTDIEPAMTVTLQELLLDALERIRRETPGIDELLLNSGDSRYPFVLLSLARDRVLFLRAPLEDVHKPTGANAPAHTAQAAYHTLTSQVRSLTTEPFSTLGRFLTGLGTTAVDTLPRLRTWDETTPPPPLANAAHPMDAAAWEQELAELVPGSATFGRIDYLVDGAAFFPALIQAIGAAREKIRIRLYIFDNDDYAVKVADMLKARSAEVPVRILLDGLGTITGGMAQPGFTPDDVVHGPVSIAAYLRADSEVRVRMLPNPWMQGDHTKVLIFDDQVAFLGGMNIGREYRYEWHDLMVALEGPVIDRLTHDFDAAWRRAGLLGELRMALNPGERAVREPGSGDYPLRLLYTRTGDSQILRTQIAALRRARQRVWIENAYLTSDAVLHELIAARRRGVDVRVVLPYRTDAGFIGRSNIVAANLLLQHGVRVYIYPGMSHVKAALYDGWACLGSANFDRLSLRLNRETNIATSHPAAVERLVSQVFLPDFARALELHEPLPTSWLDYLKEMIADQL